MRDDLKNILSKAEGNADQEDLLKYLNSELDNAEMYHIEKLMLDDDFDSDALEGLQTVKNKEKLALVVDALNRDLKIRIAKKTKARSKLALKPQWWLYFIVLIFLLIIVMIYFFLHKGMG